MTILYTWFKKKAVSLCVFFWHRPFAPLQLFPFDINRESEEKDSLSLRRVIFWAMKHAPPQKRKRTFPLTVLSWLPAESTLSSKRPPWASCWVHSAPLGEVGERRGGGGHWSTSGFSEVGEDSLRFMYNWWDSEWNSLGNSDGVVLCSYMCICVTTVSYIRERRVR